MQISRRGLDTSAVESIHALPDDTNELGVAFLVEPPDHFVFALGNVDDDTLARQRTCAGVRCSH
jgi:hypothetical protein